ncbi:MAG TPA: dihydrofolate reductase family protein [Vicinamibacterales bacterium]|nr:dihydrofolate reductase family protein [Vicinamibacterales bacterium]
MSAQIQELYPHPGTTRALDGTYLAHELNRLGTPAQPFVYANFVSSLDGRIAVVEADTGESYVLEDLTSGHDWRLFQELQAQADCMVTHGGYLRALAARKFQDILQVGVGRAVLDIGAWRRAHGLTRQPAIAIVSRTLDFPLPPSLEQHGQTVHIITAEGALADRVRLWRERGCEVVFAGAGTSVEGASLLRTLGERGYARLYLLAGPQMLETVLRDGSLSRLYLTVTHQLIGGEMFHTLSAGPRLGRAGRLQLRTLYYDPVAPKGTGQWFASFDVRREA